MKISRFTDLEVWKEAHVLTLLIYEATKHFPNEERFGLTSQIRRAVISIESCIAEGFDRYHYKSRLSFYYDSRGSLGELQSQIITSRDLNYISVVNFEKIYYQADKVRIILAGLIRSTENLSKK